MVHNRPEVHGVGRQTERATSEIEHFRSILQSYMDQKGLRSTDQRKLIVETFFRADNHVSIEELLAQVRAQDRRVGYATVYRTLKLLTECGVANERRFGDGLTRYELADDATHHDHLICVECSDIVEFEEPRIEELQDRIAKRYGFELRSHKHELYGVCPACQAKRRGGSNGN
jgi:Fur family ferric uptake transcriptional regulator